jgi:hypothetical protein
VSCQLEGPGCSGSVAVWNLWHEDQAGQVLLCDAHSAPLRELLAASDPMPPPRRERSVMQVTPLKTTPATRGLKK